MPPFRFLFAKHKAGERPAPDALKFPPGFAPASGYEIVPNAEARTLVQYLLSLKANAPLPETK